MCPLPQKWAPKFFITKILYQNFNPRFALTATKVQTLDIVEIKMRQIVRERQGPYRYDRCAQKASFFAAESCLRNWKSWKETGKVEFFK